MYRRNGRGRLLLLAFLALSILIITLDFRGSIGPLERVKDAAQAVIVPIQRGVNVVTRPVGNFFSSIGDLARLREDNRDLEAEVAILRAKSTQADAVLAENQRLKEHLDLDEPWFTQERVAAEVISDAPGNYRWAVVINRGTEDGIGKDMPVVNPEGLVGKVISVEANQSTVLLLIDPRAGAAATTEKIGRSGVTSGNGEGEDISLDLVPRDAEIEEGDKIVTSNLNGGIFPPGIPIGDVSAVGADLRETSLDVLVDPYVEFGKLDVVEVLLGSDRARVAGAGG